MPVWTAVVGGDATGTAAVTLIEAVTVWTMSCSVATIVTGYVPRGAPSGTATRSVAVAGPNP